MGYLKTYVEKIFDDNYNAYSEITRLNMEKENMPTMNKEKFVGIVERLLIECVRKDNNIESVLPISDVINCTELEPEFKQALDDLCKKFNKPTKKRF